MARRVSRVDWEGHEFTRAVRTFYFVIPSGFSREESAIELARRLGKVILRAPRFLVEEVSEANPNDCAIAIKTK
jgi:hypothetical protein